MFRKYFGVFVPVEVISEDSGIAVIRQFGVDVVVDSSDVLSFEFIPPGSVVV